MIRRPPVSAGKSIRWPLARKLQLDAVVDQPFAPQPLADADLVQQVDRALLEDAGADPLLDVLAAPVLEDDRVDALEVQQMREHQPGGTGADDPDLGALAPQPQISPAVSTMQPELRHLLVYG